MKFETQRSLFLLIVILPAKAFERAARIHLCTAIKVPNDRKKKQKDFD